MFPDNEDDSVDDEFEEVENTIGDETLDEFTAREDYDPEDEESVIADPKGFILY